MLSHAFTLYELFVIITIIALVAMKAPKPVIAVLAYSAGTLAFLSAGLELYTNIPKGMPTGTFEEPLLVFLVSGTWLGIKLFVGANKVADKISDLWKGLLESRRSAEQH